jgi:hypothetical protein
MILPIHLQQVVNNLRILTRYYRKERGDYPPKKTRTGSRIEILDFFKFTAIITDYLYSGLVL